MHSPNPGADPEEDGQNQKAPPQSGGEPAPGRIGIGEGAASWARLGKESAGEG